MIIINSHTYDDTKVFTRVIEAHFYICSACYVIGKVLQNVDKLSYKGDIFDLHDGCELAVIERL